MKLTLENKMTSIISMVFFAIVAIASTADIIVDLSLGARMGHIIQESIIAAFSLILFFILYSDIKKQKKQNNLLISQLAEIKEISEKASEELIKAKRDFGAVVTKQFSIWRFTESESDIALFLLKGFNSKEIAELRGTSDKTTRNQLTSIYQKAGVSGKHTLIAWFMDDLLISNETKN